MAYNLTGTTSVTPTTASDTSIELTRISVGAASLVGSSAILTTWHIMEDNDAGDKNTDNANGPFNNGGYNVQSNGGVLRFEPGSTVLGGSYQVRGSTTSGQAGGELIVDGGVLTCARIGLEGQAGRTGTGAGNFTPTTPAGQLPKLRIINGGIVNLFATSYQVWRAFGGNWNRGQMLFDDFRVNFSPDGAFTGFNGGGGGQQPFGTGRANLFLGFRSDMRNGIFYGMNKCELNGPVTLQDVTFDYTSATNAAWWNEGNIGRGGLYLAAQPEILATLGDSTFIYDSETNIINSSGNASIKLAMIREAASRLTIAGEVSQQWRIGTDDALSYTYHNHDLEFEAAANDTQDYNRTFTLSQDIEFSASRLSATGVPEGNANGKYALIDNRDLFQVNHASLTNGAIPTSRYTWYNQPMHALSVNGNNTRVAYGYATGKGTGSGTAHIQWGAGNNRANRVNYLTGDSDATLDVNTQASNRNQVVRMYSDMRRFYPFRQGFWQWGYYPDFVSSGFGGTTFLPTSGATIGDLEVVEAETAPLKRGYQLSTSVFEDPALIGIGVDSEAHPDVSLTAPTTSGDNLVVHAADSDNFTLDNVYHAIQKWSYDRFDGDTGATWTATDPGSANRDVALTVATGTPSTAGQMQFFTNSAGTTAAAANANWNTLQACRQAGRTGLNTGSTIFSHYNGTDADNRHDWLEGHIYIYRSAGNWGFFSFARNYQETNGTNLDAARLTHIASEGNIGANGNALNAQIFELQDSSDQIVYTNNARTYLWSTAVGMEPVVSNGTNMETRVLELRQDSDAGQEISKGTIMTTLNLTQDSDVFNANSGTINIDVSGAGSITNVRAGTNNIAIAAGSNISSRIQFAGGSSYLVGGDISNATLELVGSGVANIIYFGDGTGPTAQAGFSFTKNVTVSFIGTTAWNTTDIDSDIVANIEGVHRLPTASTGGTSVTPTRSVSGTTLSYNYQIPVANNLHYAFAARKNATGEFYDVVTGSSAVTLSPSHTLVETATNVVPVTTGQGLTDITGWTTHLNYIRDNDVVELISAAPSGTDKMGITISNAAIAGLLSHGQYITRLVQQKGNYLQNVARGWYPANGWTIGTDRIIYNNENVTWQKSSANNNLISYGIQTLLPAGGGANFAITTTNTQTAIIWNGPQNIGILNEAQAATLGTLARRSDVWAANAAL